jgi:hypothetical protein
MPLRRGHLAVLIAAGFLNNILLEAGDRRVVVKGRTYKETSRSSPTTQTSRSSARCCARQSSRWIFVRAGSR